MPGIAETSKRVTDALATLPGSHYSGDFVAQPDAALSQGAVDAYKGSADLAALMSQFVQGQLGNFQSQAPRGDPADLTGVIDAAINPVMRNLTENLLPGIKSSSLASGAYSGDRATMLLPQLAIRDANESAQRLGAQISYQDHTDRANRDLQAFGLDTQRMGLLPDITDTVMRMSSSQGDLLSQALAVKAMQDQAGIDNSLSRDRYELEYPFRGLDIATQLLGSLSGNYGTTTGSGNSTQVEKTGGLGNVLQGVMGAAGLAAGLGAFGPLGTVGSAMSKAATPASVMFNSRSLDANKIFGPIGG
jgi:hypothetical protein